LQVQKKGTQTEHDKKEERRVANRLSAPKSNPPQEHHRRPRHRGGNLRCKQKAGAVPRSHERTSHLRP
jgi:hypothetical protein